MGTSLVVAQILAIATTPSSSGKSVTFAVYKLVVCVFVAYATFFSSGRFSSTCVDMDKTYRLNVGCLCEGLRFSTYIN